MVMRGSHSKDYSAATRIFGLVDGNLLWRWDVATGRRPTPAATALKRTPRRS